ncbi:DDB1- and CUL4-associated factor 4-like isoform X2 [Zingiber officinale]|uniref:DDB1- and CUL4-associated factor 4-like isoform X2 n=1 Tax=Zingiber officinale TaxID=94328 RepID=UPI001C4B2A9E|nr:DDB1- and CUL4-associated factor 4-like isoform X2 [Zingiber officinale]
MTLPKDIPGFYYDSEKNRYFPTKGPIPGSKRPPSASAASSLAKRAANGKLSSPDQDYLIHKSCKRKHLKSSVLLQFRELHGRSIFSNRHRCNFEQEYQKLQASRAKIWRYSDSAGVSGSALEQLSGIVQTPIGLEQKNILPVGCRNGYLCLYDVSTSTHSLDYSSECTPEFIWPSSEKQIQQDSAIASLWHLISPFPILSSTIISIKRLRRNCPDGAESVPSFNALLSTFGSEAIGGSVCILKLDQPIDQHYPSLCSQIVQLVSLDRTTIWTSDCNPQGTQAVIGSNRGSGLIDLESRKVSWLYHNGSDALSQQFVHPGNIVLSGHRNGVISSIDIRQKQSRIPEHAFGYPRRLNFDTKFRGHPFRNEKSTGNQKYKSGRNLNSSDVVYMPKAVCSLVALQSDDQYFLASSLDGSINLYDRRLLKKGAVQSYAGHVNSYTHLQLGVNPSETLVVSGGEDCFLRIWSIKSGELVFGEKVSNSKLTSICWPKTLTCFTEDSCMSNHSLGAWLGSPDGLFYMHGS